MCILPARSLVLLFFDCLPFVCWSTPMRILMTGHMGYIGSVMAPFFEQNGHNVVGLDNGLFEGCILGQYHSHEPSWRIDLRDIESADLVGFDAIVHLAALSNDPLSNINPYLTYDINHRASVRLARLAKEAGV